MDVKVHYLLRVAMFTQTIEYALRAIVYLAANPARRLNRSEIAEATHVPDEYLNKVLRELAAAGIVGAQRGPKGGYELVKAPGELSVFEVVAAVGSIPRIEQCPLGIAEHVDLCPLHAKLDAAAEQIETAFKNTTVDELVPRPKSKSSCEFPRR